MRDGDREPLRDADVDRETPREADDVIVGEKPSEIVRLTETERVRDGVTLVLSVVERERLAEADGVRLELRVVEYERLTEAEREREDENVTLRDAESEVERDGDTL